MLLMLPGDVKDAVLAKLDQFIFSRGRAARRRDGHVRADGGRRSGGGMRSLRVRSAASPIDDAGRDGRARQLQAAWPAAGSGDRDASRRTRASRDSTCTSSARVEAALRRALIEAGAAEARRRRRPRRSGSRRACRCFTATWTRRRFRSRRASSRARSASRRAATSARKSSSASCTAATAAWRGSSSACVMEGDAVPPAGARDSRRRARDRPRDEQHAVAGAADARSRSATSTATSSSRARR